MIAWNTVYMVAANDRLRIDGQPVEESDLGHLSPCRYERINRLPVPAGAGLRASVGFCPFAGKAKPPDLLSHDPKFTLCVRSKQHYTNGGRG